MAREAKEQEFSADRHAWQSTADSDAVSRRAVGDLESELARTKAQLQSVIQNYESAIEELHAAREEVHVANEELQEATQELLSERDQLRESVADCGFQNESLIKRLKETSTASEEMSSLLDMLDIPVLVLGADLALRHFTIAASRLWNLLPTDLGRQVGHLVTTLKVPQIEPLCKEAMADLSPRALHAYDSAGRPISLLIRPFAGRKCRVVRVAVILTSPDFEISGKTNSGAASVSKIIESALPRIQAALGKETLIEIDSSPHSLSAIANPDIFEGVLVRSALAAQQTVIGRACVKIRSYAVDAQTAESQAHMGVPPGDYVAVSIAATPVGASKTPSGRRLRGMQVPELPIRELGAFYRVEYSAGLDSRLTIYLRRAEM